MKITLKDGKPAPEKNVQKLEAALGCPISGSVRRFVSEYDGARPETHRFQVGKNNGSSVNRFIPTSEILAERQYIDNIPSQAYPIAWDSCGNYVLVDEGNGGQVYFWDHELPDDENIIKLADNFDEFLSMLEPFDIDSIKIKPEQVLSVWVHPDIERIIKEQQERDKS